ncbi:MAG TPA: hypothetical protein VFX73_10565 [Chitinophagaceae bacterium]|nr:hypothetical protein [Chitinophagaceae bacterium]
MNSKPLAGLAVMLFLCLFSHAQGADPKQAMAKIKQNLDASMKALAGYEWTETTTIFKGNEAKSKKQNKCMYSADGKVVKTPIADPSAAKEKDPRGVRGKIAENKKEEISDYVKKSVARIHEYLPPQSDKLQAIYGAGKTKIQVLEPNKRYKLDFPDYKQTGDLLGVSLDLAKGLLGGVTVNTYVDKPSDKISFQLTFAQLTDGTEYPSEIVLDLPSQGMKVVIKNDSYIKR